MINNWKKKAIQTYLKSIFNAICEVQLEDVTTWWRMSCWFSNMDERSCCKKDNSVFFSFILNVILVNSYYLYCFEKSLFEESDDVVWEMLSGSFILVILHTAKLKKKYIYSQ